MAFSPGVIKIISEDNYNIQHLCDSSGGSSGGPLINKNNYQVIGIHKGGGEGTKNYNLGTLLKEPIKQFIEQNKNIIDEKENNIKKEYIKENEDKKEDEIKAKENNKDKIEVKDKNEENLNLINKVKKSICEIIKDNGYGIGYFCKIKFEDNEICCLFSNNHVIAEDILLNKENIKIKFNNEIYNILLKLKRRIWNNKNLDFICIEIINDDKLITKIEPFEIDTNCYNIEYNVENYDKKEIILVSIGGKGNIELYKDIIYYEKNNNERFYYNNKIDNIGGPIILNNNLRLVGINCGFEKNKNIGIYYKEIIENIKENEIKCIIDIKVNEIKEGILLFNENENNKEEIKNNIKIYIKDEIIEIKNIDKKYIINNKFEKDGKYEIKIIFKNNLTNLNSFFENCNELISLDLSKFDTSKVTDMGWMFNLCHKLKEIKGINNFNTINVTNMYGMFQECNELISLDLSNFDTSKVNDMSFIFYGCLNLKYLNLENFSINNNCKTESMFSSNIKYKVIAKDKKLNNLYNS